MFIGKFEIIVILSIVIEKVLGGVAVIFSRILILVAKTGVGFLPYISLYMFS
jgi:hypothetical protein